MWSIMDRLRSWWPRRRQTEAPVELDAAPECRSFSQLLRMACEEKPSVWFVAVVDRSVVVYPFPPEPPAGEPQ
jgi:hypothetical protein